MLRWHEEPQVARLGERLPQAVGEGVGERALSPVRAAVGVSTDTEARAELIALGSRSTPTIKVGGDVLIGFNPAKLVALLGR